MGFQPTPTENEVLQACMEWLRFNGVFAWRQGNTGVWRADIQRHVFHGLKGVSDILGIMPPTSSIPGRFLAIECKRPGNKPTKEQDEFMDAIARNGGLATWVTSVDELETDLRPFITPNQSRMEF